MAKLCAVHHPRDRVRRETSEKKNGIIYLQSYESAFFLAIRMQIKMAAHRTP